MKALVNRIIHTSVVDGPGNRAAIFLQGCNYTCSYCHNPETIHRCVHCGVCVPVCPTGALTWRWAEENETSSLAQLYQSWAALSQPS